MGYRDDELYAQEQMRRFRLGEQRAYHTAGPMAAKLAAELQGLSDLSSVITVGDCTRVIANGLFGVEPESFPIVKNGIRWRTYPIEMDQKKIRWDYSGNMDKGRVPLYAVVGELNEGVLQGFYGIAGGVTDRDHNPIAGQKVKYIRIQGSSLDHLRAIFPRMLAHGPTYTINPRPRTH